MFFHSFSPIDTAYFILDKTKLLGFLGPSSKSLISFAYFSGLFCWLIQPWLLAFCPS
jgi:hypothetical protein